MRVLVCGGRDYRDPARISEVLGALLKHKRLSLLIHGDGFGADSWANAWAMDSGVDQVKFPANWSGRGSDSRDSLRIRREEAGGSRG